MSDPRFGHSYSKDSTCHIFCGFLTYPRKVTRILLGDPRVSRYNWAMDYGPMERNETP